MGDELVLRGELISDKETIPFRLRLCDKCQKHLITQVGYFMFGEEASIENLLCKNCLNLLKEELSNGR